MVEELFSKLAALDYLQGYDFTSHPDQSPGFSLTPLDKTLVKAENIRRLLPEDMSGLRVLDIGCNKGFFALECRRRGAEYVLGIDTLSNIIEILQAIVAASPLFTGVEFQCTSFSNEVIAKGPFDVVLFCSSYHYVYAEVKSHTEIFSMLAALDPRQLILELPLELDDQFARRVLESSLTGEQLKAYNVHAILHAASVSFGSVRYIANSGFLRTRDIFLLEDSGTANPYRFEWEGKSDVWGKVRP